MRLRKNHFCSEHITHPRVHFFFFFFCLSCDVPQLTKAILVSPLAPHPQKKRLKDFPDSLWLSFLLSHLRKAHKCLKPPYSMANTNNMNWSDDW
jgi:hypothetical protein